MKRPFAYVCAPETWRSKENAKACANYCRALYKMGYLPIAPHFMLQQFTDKRIPKDRKNIYSMAEDILRRCRVVVVCGGVLTKSMMSELELAERLNIPTMLSEGLFDVKEYTEFFR